MFKTGKVSCPGLLWSRIRAMRLIRSQAQRADGLKQSTRANLQMAKRNDMLWLSFASRLIKYWWLFCRQLVSAVKIRVGFGQQSAYVHLYGRSQPKLDKKARTCWCASVRRCASQSFVTRCSVPTYSNAHARLLLVIRSSTICIICSGVSWSMMSIWGSQK